MVYGTILGFGYHEHTITDYHCFSSSSSAKVTAEISSQLWHNGHSGYLLLYWIVGSISWSTGIDIALYT